MKKNNKGFFLAEAIIIIALVTTVMAFVYPNVSKLYENYKNSVDYYDQPEDLYTLKAVYDYMLSSKKENGLNYIENYTKDEEGNVGCKKYSSETNKKLKIDYFSFSDTEISYKFTDLYITDYMTEVSDTDTDFNRYLKRLKKTTNDKASYRLIGVFEKDNIKRYASIKIDNPNPNRNCNLGG